MQTEPATQAGGGPAAERARRDEREAARSQAARASRLMARAEEVAQIGSWEWTPETGELLWSDNLFRIYGHEPQEITPTIDWVIERTHPDDRDLVAAETERLARTGRQRHLVYRIQHPDGVRYLRSTVSALEDDAGPRCFMGTVQDITEAKRADHEISAHVAVAAALNRWETLKMGAEGLLSGLGEALDFDAGALWVRRADAMVARVRWQRRAAGGADRADPGTPRAGEDPSFAARAWEAGRPVSLEPGAEDTQDGPAAGGLAVPVLDGTRVLAVLEFRSRERPELTGRLSRSLIGIGHEVGQFLAHRGEELSSPALTAGELDVLRLAEAGHMVPVIAQELGLSPPEVQSRFEQINRKLGVSDRGQAVAAALRLGLLS